MCSWDDGNSADIRQLEDVNYTLDESIARVEDGYIIGVSKGITTLKVDYKGLKREIPVVVSELPEELQTSIEQVSVDDKNNKHFSTVYPNPVINFINIQINASENISEYTVEIYNLAGSKITQCFLKESLKQIDMSNYPQGIYFVRVSMGNNVDVHKVIKIEK